MHRVSRVLIAAMLLAGVLASAHAAEGEPVLPKETEHVLSVNVKQMLESEVGKKYAMEALKLLQGEDAEAWLGALGIDPLKDVERVTVGFWGEWEKLNAVGVVKGAFDAKKVVAAAKATAENRKYTVESVTEKADGKEVTLVKMKTTGGKSLYLTVADEKNLLFGTDTKLAVAAVTDFNGKAKARLSKDLTTLVQKQDEKASLFYCAVTEGKFEGVLVRSGRGGFIEFHPLDFVVGDWKKFVEDGLQKMETADVTVSLGKEATFKAVLGMKDADAAKEFKGIVEQAVQTLVLFGGQDPTAKTLTDDLTKTRGVKAKDKEMTLSFSLTAKAIADLIGAEKK